MLLQILAIALIVIFPSIATWFPTHLHEQVRLVPADKIEDSIRLEDYGGDPYSNRVAKGGPGRDQEQQAPGPGWIQQAARSGW